MNTLKEQNVHIWDGNASREFLRFTGTLYDNDCRMTLALYMVSNGGIFNAAYETCESRITDNEGV